MNEPLQHVNLEGVELHTHDGAVIRCRMTGGPRESEFFVNVGVAEATGLAYGYLSEEMKVRARRVLEMFNTPDPEIVEAVKRLPWWTNVGVEADTPGTYNLSGTLVADPSVYFLAGNEGFEMCRPPCEEMPWYVGLYRIDEVIDFTPATTSVPALVSALDELTRSFLKGETPQEVT